MLYCIVCSQLSKTFNRSKNGAIITFIIALLFTTIRVNRVTKHGVRFGKIGGLLLPVMKYN